MITNIVIIAAIVAGVIAVLLGSGVRLVQQYEKGVMLRFGRLSPTTGDRVRSSSSRSSTA